MEVRNLWDHMVQHEGDESIEDVKTKIREYERRIGGPSIGEDRIRRLLDYCKSRRVLGKALRSVKSFEGY